MGFDDLPIPNNGTTHTVTNPLGLATVANYTRNPILDVGYQCKDCRPYFAFKYSTTTYYIRVHPNNLTAGNQIGIYAASTITKFGVTYTKMTRQSGKGTVATVGPSATITYNGHTYAYDSTGDVDVFLNKLNPWSFYKPYEFTGLTDTEYGQTRCSDLDNNTSYWDNIIKSASVTYGFNYSRTNDNTRILCNDWLTTLNNANATNSYWNYTRPSTIFRLTDFIGYNKNAKCPGGSIDWSADKVVKKVSSANQSFVYTYDNTDPNCEIDIFSIDSSLRTNMWYVGAIISEVYMNSSGIITGRNNPKFYSAGALNTVFPINPSEYLHEANIDDVILTSEGNYEVCWVLASRDDSNVNNNQPYVILPYGYSLLNYRLLNQDVIIVPYYADFSTEYPGEIIVTGQFVDFTWSQLFPAREEPGESVIDNQLSQYNSLRFFFTTQNKSNLQKTATLSIINNSVDSSSQINKTITIPGNSEYNFAVNIPFAQSYKLGDDSAGYASCGLGFKISFTYNSKTVYIDWSNSGSLTTTDPGWQYLYTNMVNNEHWLTSPNAYIWTNGYLNEYAPTLNDSSLIAI